MNEFSMLLLSLVTGLLLGFLFFGGLWLTIKKGVSSRYAFIWFTASLLLRTGIVVAGFYFVAGDRWDRLLVCLAGFLIARFLFTCFTKLREEQASLIKKEPS